MSAPRKITSGHRAEQALQRTKAPPANGDVRKVISLPWAALQVIARQKRL